MTKRSKQTDTPDEFSDTLTIETEKVCFVIVKAREFDVKDVDTSEESGSNPSDDKMIGVLEDRRDDPVQQELSGFISSLTEDERIDLVALAWLGREDYTAEDWPAVREEAARAQASYGKRTASYLLGIPMLGDHLEEGLSLLGRSCEDYEVNRL
jgi:hypothetical protein